MRNTPLAFTLPAFLFATGCAVTEPADNPSTSSVEGAATICDIAPIFCGAPPPVVQLSANAPSALTYATSSWSACTMTYVLPNGFSDSFPFPTNASGTAGAGRGVYYTLTCTESLPGLNIFAASASALVF